MRVEGQVPMGSARGASWLAGGGPATRPAGDHTACSGADCCDIAPAAPCT